MSKETILRQDSIEDVQDYATRRLWTYNNERPSMSIGGMIPIQKLKQKAD